MCKNALISVAVIPHL